MTQRSQVQTSTFRAMGCPIGLTAVGIDETRFAGDAQAIINLAERWEQLFSRFRPESGLGRLNASAGRGPRPVEPQLLDLIDRACVASRQTGGLFNPLVLPALLAAGYDRTFRAVNARPEWVAGARTAAPEIDGIGIDRSAGTVSLPAGAALDLGGIAKGAFVDAACALVGDAWPGGVINAGGDLRLWGVPPDGDDWRVGLEDPLHLERNLAMALIHDPRLAGAIATSGRNRRRWRTDRGPAHHLIDPHSGAPAPGSIETATVFAADATTADIAAKTLFLSASLTGDGNVAGGALGITIDNRGFGARWEGTHAHAISIIPLVVRTGDAA